MNTLYHTVKSTANGREHLPALVYMNKHFNYAQLLKGIDTASKALSLIGIASGDVVALCLPNVPEAVHLLYAVSKLGATAYPIHPLTPKEQMRSFLTRGKVKALICLSSSASIYSAVCEELEVILVHLNAAQSLNPFVRSIYNVKNGAKIPKHHTRDVYCYSGLLQNARKIKADIGASTTGGGVYLNSGGTGGEPKIINLSDEAINNLALKGYEAVALDEPFDNTYMLNALPYFHGFGLCMGIHTLLSLGGAVILMPKFHRDSALKYFKKGIVHYVIGVPVLYEALLSHKDFNGKNLASLKVAFVGGDFVPRDLLKRFNDRLYSYGYSAKLFEGYGLTETVTVACVNTYKFNRDETVGKALSGITIRPFDFSNGIAIASDGEGGELCISGDTLMTGYLNNQQATDDAFFDYDGKKWVKTGDYGVVKDDFVYFKQRLKRIIKVSGVLVFPSEIEQLAVSINGITSACAVEVPSAKTGSAIRLYLTAPTLSDAQKTEVQNKLTEQISSQLSSFATPEKIVFLDTLPLTSVGKIDFNKLKQS